MTIGMEEENSRSRSENRPVVPSKQLSLEEESKLDDEESLWKGSEESSTDAPIGKLHDLNLPAYLKYNPFFYMVATVRRFVDWLQGLSSQATAGLLLSIFAVQHLQKGLVQSYMSNAMSFYFRDRGGISADELQIYMAVVMTPWALKGLMGVGSDVFAVGGYHKIPFMLATSIGAIFALFTLGTSPQLSIPAALMCLFIGQMHIALNDLLIEARYSEKIQQNPSINSDMGSFVWGGMMCMSFVAVGTVGIVISTLGARYVFALVCAPIALGTIPIAFNLLGDKRLVGERSSCCVHVDTTILQRQGWDFTKLAVLMTVLSLGLAASGILVDDINFNFGLSISCGIVTIIGFYIYTPRMIANVNAYTLIQTLFSCSIEGATFYFFTDGPEQYPEGPHFSDWFYTTAIGLVAAGTAILGIVLFNLYLGDQNYQTIFTWSTLVYSSLSLVNVVVYKRWNVAWGVSDKAFVLGSSALTTVISEFNYMPAVMIMSRLCPKGMEATMFALLASASNLGGNISSYSGAFVLDYFNVRPDGSADESDQFSNLWLVSLITSVLPCLPLLLLPYLIPNARPTDPLPGIDDADDEDDHEGGVDKEKQYGVRGQNDTARLLSDDGGGEENEGEEEEE